MVAKEKLEQKIIQQNGNQTAQSDQQNIIYLTDLKTDFYEQENSIRWVLYLKSIDKDQTSVEFNEKSARIRFKLNDPNFLSLHNCSDPNTLFEWNVEFFEQVQPEKCNFTVNKYKMEIHLIKEPKFIKKWTAPIKRNNSKQDEISVASKKINIQSSPTSVSWTPTAQTNGRSSSGSPSLSPSPPPSSEVSKQQLTSKMTCTSNTSNKASTMVSTSMAQPIIKPDYYGFTGLANLGNTCYMNAALQFLINAVDLRNYFIETPQLFQKEINTKNALGQNGQMAIQFAMLIRQLWTSKQNYIVPNKLKELICHKYTHFRGFEQQDTQEFLVSLLSLLHEDLNRVHNKPYYESSLECEDDSSDKTIEIANESWKRFLSRENSVVVDNFYGQFKSKLTCPECHKVSITFEAFNNLIVPLPKPKKEIHFVLMYHVKREKYPNELSLYLDQNDKIEKLVNEVKRKLVNLKNSCFKIFVLNKNDTEEELGETESKFDTDWKMFTLECSLPNFDNSKYLILCETETDTNEPSNDILIDFRVKQVCKFPLGVYNINQCFYCLKHKENPNSKVNLPRCTKCYRAAYCDGECQRNDWQKHKTLCSKPNDIVGLPFIISIKKSQLINQETGLSFLQESLLNMCNKTVDYELTSTFKDNFFEIELINPNDTLNKTIINLNKNYDKLIEILNQTNKHISLEIRIKWCNNNTDLKVKTNLTNIKTLNDTLEKKLITLDDCFKLFTIPEKLTSDNPWYCSKCKKHQEATKQMSLWHLPKYLIITLKRFQAIKSFNDNTEDPRMKMMMMNSHFSYLLQNHVTYNKLNNMVEFPVSNLDMSKYLARPNLEDKSNYVYDLCSVINHLGQSISIGHYTAYARTHSTIDTTKDDIPWRLFDDQNVVQIRNDNQIISKDAYVLMYRLRSVESSKEKLVQTIKFEKQPSIQNILKIHEKQIEQNNDDGDGDDDEEFFDIESEESEELDDDRNSNYEEDEDELKDRTNFSKESHLNYTNLNEMD